MMNLRCDVSEDDLIAYEDGLLPSRRREEVFRHLSECPVCQQRIADYRRVDSVVRMGSTMPAHAVADRVAFRMRLAEETQRRRGGMFRRRVVVAACVIVLMAVLPVLWSSEFGSTVKDRVEVLMPDGQSHQVGNGPDDSAPSPEFITPPDDLPMGLRRRHSDADLEQTWTLYCDDEGTCIQLQQSRAEGSSADWTLQSAESVMVSGTSVALWRIGPSLISLVAWERDGIVFRIVVVDTPDPGEAGYVQSDVMAIVEAVMRAQDSQ